jgi:hypothetical protein
MDLHLDYEAIGKILRETCAAPINKLALEVAANARGNSDTPAEATVTVKAFTTDRAVAVVMLAHPAAEALQAVHGILTRAAAEAGLETRSK